MLLKNVYSPHMLVSCYILDQNYALLRSLHANWNVDPTLMDRFEVKISDFESTVLSPDLRVSFGGGQKGKLHSVTLRANSLQTLVLELDSNPGHATGWLTCHKLDNELIFHKLKVIFSKDFDFHVLPLKDIIIFLAPINVFQAQAG